MTEDEFWRSTLAKVVALYDVKRLDWDKTRDYFLAQIASFQANRYLRSKESDRVWNPNDFLSMVYPDGKKESVIITSRSGSEKGASGGRELKASMKAMTEKRARQKRKLKPFNPRKKS